MRHAAPRRGAKTARAARDDRSVGDRKPRGQDRGDRPEGAYRRPRGEGMGGRESGRSRARAVQRARQAGLGAHATTTTGPAAMLPGAIAHTPAHAARVVGAEARVAGSARVQLVTVPGDQEAGPRRSTPSEATLEKGPVRRVRAGTVRHAADADEARPHEDRRRARFAAARSWGRGPTPSGRPRTACGKPFSMSWTHAYGDPVAGTRVIDLFAGTGAMGLEALSRGARLRAVRRRGRSKRAASFAKTWKRWA